MNKLLKRINLKNILDLVCFLLVLLIYAKHHNYSWIESMLTAFGIGYFILVKGIINE